MSGKLLSYGLCYPLIKPMPHLAARISFIIIATLLSPEIGWAKAAAPAGSAVMTDITSGLKLIQEIDPAKTEPDYESTSGASQVETILGQPARTMPPGEEPKAIAYIIGKDKNLQAGKAYVLEVEHPDDVPRTIYLANRGADYLRGLSTGQATGDVRAQYVEPSLESLEYPLSGQWKPLRQFFFLLDRFQGVKGYRDAQPGWRPYTPSDGFHLVIFQAKQMNDPRSEGAAIGKIRLYEVPAPEALYAGTNLPPDDLPRRRVFWREEMADQIIQTNDPELQAVQDPIAWYEHKIGMAKVLGFNTFSKDLLEFGFNQGWESGDQSWVIEAQPPNRDLWTRLVQKAGEAGMDLLPYYEYKTGIGLTDDSLAKQRRSQKLYHGIKQTAGSNTFYTGVSWTEGHNGDLTDPDTLVDAKRLMDMTVLSFKDDAKFAGVWFRTRYTHLPISFSPVTMDRFKADHPGDDAAASVTQESMIASYEGDRTLYDKYLGWWFKKRAEFLAAILDHLRAGLETDEVQVLFTTFTSEAVPTLHNLGAYHNHPGVVTDDPHWWEQYASTIDDGWWKWHLMPTPFERVAEENLYRGVLHENPPIDHPMNTDSSEYYHSAPPADPANYKSIDGVMMTYPIGRLFTLENPELLEEFRAKSGLTVARHYPLNEDSGKDNAETAPFGHLLGYLSVDSDRAGDHLMLQQARAVAYGDPRNIAYLSGSSFSTWNPEVMRRFNQAFLAVPALPSKLVPNLSSDHDVIVREISTLRHGTYYYVVNTSMHGKKDVIVTLPGDKAVVDLLTGSELPSQSLKLNLASAQLNAYRVGP